MVNSPDEQRSNAQLPFDSTVALFCAALEYGVFCVVLVARYVQISRNQQQPLVMALWLH